MHFTISFRLLSTGRTRCKITWEDGRLSGDEVALVYVRALLTTLGARPFALSPTGPMFQGDPVADPLAFLVFCQNVLRDVRVTGDGPTLESEPGVVY